MGPTGVQGLGGPDELLRRTRQVRPSGDGHPRFGKPLQGQKALHYIVVEGRPSLHVYDYYFLLINVAVFFFLGGGRSVIF